MFILATIGRGRAFPPQSINSQIIFSGECSAQNLPTQGQFICKSKEGRAFAYKDFGDNLQISAQMLCPYSSILWGILGFMSIIQKEILLKLWCDRRDRNVTRP